MRCMDSPLFAATINDNYAFRGKVDNQCFSVAGIPCMYLSVTYGLSNNFMLNKHGGHSFMDVNLAQNSIRYTDTIFSAFDEYLLRRELMTAPLYGAARNY